METKNKIRNIIIFIVLLILAVAFLFPIAFVLLNSFKGKLFIANEPFAFLSSENFVGIQNYIDGIEQTGFFTAMKWSLVITVGSVLLILLGTSMTAYWITRVKSKVSSVLYYAFVFSMIVPFQMVMFTMTSLADTLKMRNPIGMIILYLGFGAGLSVFMFSGFVKSVPLEIEEAAMIDGCNPLQTFFRVVFPILKPTAVTVAILNAMWIWNDYLLPYLVVGLTSEYKTIPVRVQYLLGSHGSFDMGIMMGLLVLSILPIIIFYAFCQKFIIEGVVAGAVKG
ncbi:MAG: carbohydrate ABC transporter permease [Lachnospiraceae bacterium]|nr:carbohydrate ABC transporter permease [Lachnospiraceae bacterium]MDE6698549.1 carbohydrate ABC transporter permease [Lachnospiraceae bacterium]